ncbi:MAG: hypothetical protein KF789_05230 [Bdellovibrionaceae bacterium]|nr:hypothetical protein [Pseudobdellovibrionaceae bacterium]
MKNMKWFIGLIPFALMGCGGDDGALIQGGTASAAQMQQAAVVQTIGSVLKFTDATAGVPIQPGETLPGGVGTLSVGPFAGPFDDCKENLADDDTDNDGDTIPAHVKISYNCTSIPGTGTTKGKFIGTYEAKDLKDIDLSTKHAAGGYEYNYDLHQVNADAPAPGVPQWESFWQGGYSARPTSSGFIMSSDFASWIKGDHPPVAPSTKWTKLDWGVKVSHKSTYVPKFPATPYAVGVVRHEGLFKMEGSVGPDTSGRDLGVISVVFKITSTDLEYDSTVPCNYYKSGEMSFEGSPGTKLTLKFACTTMEAFFNGKSIPFTY